MLKHSQEPPPAQDQRIRAQILCEFIFWVAINETEVFGEYGIVVMCITFLHRNANISVFLEWNCCLLDQGDADNLTEKTNKDANDEHC